MYLHQFSNKISLSILTRGILVIAILFFSSCAGKSERDYNYIETSMHTDLAGTSPKERKHILIRAKSDSDAYLKAYLNFCISKKYYNKEFQKSGAKAGKPISFRLLNEDSIDIVRSVSFINKERLEKRIEKRVSTFELQQDKEK